MDWPVVVRFCILSAFVIFITLDLDRPRTGLIRLDIAEQAMLDLRVSSSNRQAIAYTGDIKPLPLTK